MWEAVLLWVLNQEYKNLLYRDLCFRDRVSCSEIVSGAIWHPTERRNAVLCM